MSKNLALLENFPKPKLILSENKISLKTSGIVYGNFEISSGSDAEISGSVTAAADFLSFSPAHFIGNKIQIEYTLDLTEISGEIFTKAVVTTSGGEKIIDFHVVVNPPNVLSKDGIDMADLEDFANYAKNEPAAARALFSRQEFMMWLLNIGYPCMDIYEIFAADPNKERALDNFLIFNGKKFKAKIVPESLDLNHNIDMINSDSETGSIILQKTTWGQAEARLAVVSGEKWLKLSNEKIVAADFDENNLAEAHYIILPQEIDKKDGHAEAVVEILSDGAPARKINIRARPAVPFEARLDKESFFFEDRGKVYIKNNTGRDLMVEINCEQFVKFDAKRYLISKEAEIDFEVKYGNFKTATLSFKKQIYAQTMLNVVAVDAARNHSQKLILTLWGM